MKKIVLVMFAASMGFASSVWSAQGGVEESLSKYGEVANVKVVPKQGNSAPTSNAAVVLYIQDNENLKMVPRPRPIKPPLLTEIHQS